MALRIALTLRFTFHVGFCSGFVCFNLSAAKMSPTYVDVVRSGEPVATVLVNYLLHRKHYPLRVLLTLIPIMGGVLIASLASKPKATVSDEAYPMIPLMGVIYACCSNLSFCFRPFCLQRLQAFYQHQHQHAKLDDLQLFFYLTTVASLSLPVFVILFEAKTIYATYQEHSDAKAHNNMGTRD